MGQTYDIDAKKDNDQKKKTSWLSGLLTVIVLVGVFLFFRYAVVITIISGNSMAPTIENQNIVLSNHLLFNLDRNDIIIYHDEHGFDVIKRIIALPNDTIEIKDGIVIVNDLPLEEDYVIGIPNDMGKLVVHENSYFVMGDNRTPGESLDSRNVDVGPISEEQIKGKVVCSIFPFTWLVSHE